MFSEQGLAKKSFKKMSLNALLITFSFLSQLDGSNKRRHIKLKEIMDIDLGKKNFYDDGMAQKCNQCESTSSGLGHLSTHLKTHSGEKSNKCNQCDYASSQTGYLRRHLKTHSGEKSNN